MMHPSVLLLSTLALTSLGLSAGQSGARPESSFTNGNSASGVEAFVGGGKRNRALGDRSVVVGGYGNTSADREAAVVGGMLNVAVRSSFIGGGRSNEASALSVVAGGDQNMAEGGSAIGGGSRNRAMDTSTVAGGFANFAVGSSSTVGGGGFNAASALHATVAGGGLNYASTGASTVGGGYSNNAVGVPGDTGQTIAGGMYNRVSSSVSTIGGGTGNEASGLSATIPGGWSNTAEGDFSFAAGREAIAEHRGAFVWGDSTTTEKPSSAPDEFNVYAGGGTRIFSSSDGSAGVQLAPGAGSWTSVSDRNAKENVETVDGREVLAQLASVPIATWNYKSQDASIRHMGPMAQDFYAAFGLGLGENSIDTIDPDGVALAAIQGLHALVQEKDAENRELRATVATLSERLKRLEAAVGVTER